MVTALVTGGTGFVGGWTIASLLDRGDTVRTTVRDAAKADAVLGRFPDADGRLTVIRADLLGDDGWAEATAGCDVVHHVASPLTATRDEEQVIRPAVDGVLRVLRAARDSGVPRVVATSSCGAVYYGHPSRETPFDESDWTNVEGGPMSAYVKSKALAERAAWEFMEREGGGLALTTVCPTGIFGPARSADATSSLRLIDGLLSGRPPAVPNVWLNVVDVRDVVDLHLRAADAEVAANRRYIAATDGVISMLDIARELRARLGDRAKGVPTRTIPDLVLRLVGRFAPEVGDLVPLLGQSRAASSARARDELGWRPRAWQDAVTASAESLLDLRGRR
ncbi:NAD-dependent epimerase/dehydratase family protein [Tsukamurella ocularis]|uniref:NAD-dependent epimerase/dehydratase family protein n=1 Tax=Tsukamurella ocularis TaxID=1970234 RepID=UPI00216A2640|nr:NAD-dependent epimerase/dehydratase family protein [Tsukamurella ocularis]MCS3781267.1 dihydroflavonol-4-reductase [Tsukamurella ocularis]MCS3787638.1 dihydroflavonol-4-reductase [Tsukamurella ocularis]MCS3850933.1 dihydroflavonol-4-reductase [Tsukamurella ocularis]